MRMLVFDLDIIHIGCVVSMAPQEHFSARVFVIPLVGVLVIAVHFTLKLAFTASGKDVQTMKVNLSVAAMKNTMGLVLNDHETQFRESGNVRTAF